jgi:GAF domain-containing protein
MVDVGRESDGMQRPLADLAEVARLAEGDEDAIRVLGRIVGHAVTLVPGCTGAALTLLVAGAEETATVTDERVERCHAVQFRPGGSGPAREVLHRGEPRRCDDVEAEDRWPLFARTAAENGFRSCLALPLRYDGQVATALNLYADRPSVFTGITFDVALLFAAEGGVALDNAEIYRTSHELVEHLHRALTSRSLIERAKGVLMSRHGLTGDEAFDLLRQQSQHTHRKLYDVAVALLREQDPGTCSGNVGFTPPRRPSARGFPESGGAPRGEGEPPAQPWPDRGGDPS